MRNILALILVICFVDFFCRTSHAQNINQFINGKNMNNTLIGCRWYRNMLTIPNSLIYSFDTTEIKENGFKEAYILSAGSTYYEDERKISIFYDTLSIFFFNENGHVTREIAWDHDRRDTVDFPKKNSKNFHTVVTKNAQDSICKEFYLDTDGSGDTITIRTLTYNNGLLIEQEQRATKKIQSKYPHWFDTAGMDYHIKYKYNKDIQLTEFIDLDSKHRHKISYVSDGRQIQSYKSDSIYRTQLVKVRINKDGVISESGDSNFTVVTPLKKGSNLISTILEVGIQINPHPWKYRIDYKK